MELTSKDLSGYLVSKSLNLLVKTPVIPVKQVYSCHNLRLDHYAIEVIR